MTLEYENGDINDEIQENHHDDEIVHDFIEAIEFLLGLFILSRNFIKHCKLFTFVCLVTCTFLISQSFL